MAVSFNNIPANVRVPFFYAEVDNSQASTFQRNNRSLLIGTQDKTNEPPGIPVFAGSVDSVKDKYGENSQLAQMYTATRNNDSAGEVWVAPLSKETPSMSDLLLNMGDEEYDYIANPISDIETLNKFKLEMDDVTGRWSWSKQIFGHVYSVKRGNAGALQTLGKLRNDQHNTIYGIETGVPATDHEYLAARMAREAGSLSIDPARPTQTLSINGLTGAKPEERFIFAERNSLLYAGISTHYTSKDGTIRAENSITTYQTNSWGYPDNSYLQTETLHTLAYIIRYLRQRITSKYGRHKLANNGTRFGAGQAIVTPNIIRAEIIAAYEKLEQKGLVENAKMFAKFLIVERDIDNPNRVNVLFPPDLINQLRIFALLAQFRLQY